MAEIMKYTQEGFNKLKEEYEFRSKIERERIKVAITPRTRSLSGGFERYPANCL